MDKGHVEVLREMLPFYAEAPAVQSALRAAIAALSSEQAAAVDSPQPVKADDAMVERFIDRLNVAEREVFGEPKTPRNGARFQCIRAALTAALEGSKHE